MMIVDTKGNFFSTRHIWFDDLYNNKTNISSGGADEVFYMPIKYLLSVVGGDGTRSSTL